MSETLPTQTRMFRSTHRWARISPTKVRPVADLIRKRPVPEAFQILDALDKRGAAFLRKVLKTAVANAQDQDAELDAEDLRIAEIRVDGGPAMKRGRIRAFGRMAHYKHRTSHITIVVRSAAEK